ncbi:MAG: TlpA family protein disulfide reductase [Pseudodesulfovibrio sp.]|uniref:TlpA family protein disulfide reductase n=1 Tax=Pseudodesulfovibrio sp. TaxID=2035812 RepID=UPI003D0B08DB
MIKMWRIFALAIFVLVMGACSGESGTAPEKSGAASAETSAAPSHAPAQDGIPFLDEAGLDKYLKDNAGRPTMLFFWATWCPSCKQEIPELVALQESHGDKVNIIALSVDENREALEKYLEKKPMDLPVYWGDQGLARKFRVEAIPTLVIFDKTGKQIFGQAGVYPHSMLGAMADKLNQ